MTENKKIELFDKWYDENYDEWAEGEEGIALREELEQAFKGGIAELEKENEELKLKLEALEGKTPWKDIKDKSKLIEKLTQAKELLKFWVNDFYDSFNNSNTYEKRHKALEQSEQFLKENENV